MVATRFISRFHVLVGLDSGRLMTPTRVLHLPAERTIKLQSDPPAIPLNKLKRESHPRLAHDNGFTPLATSRDFLGPIQFQASTNSGCGFLSSKNQLVMFKNIDKTGIALHNATNKFDDLVTPRVMGQPRRDGGHFVQQGDIKTHFAFPRCKISSLDRKRKLKLALPFSCDRAQGLVDRASRSCFETALPGTRPLRLIARNVMGISPWSGNENDGNANSRRSRNS